MFCIVSSLSEKNHCTIDYSSNFFLMRMPKAFKKNQIILKLGSYKSHQ